MPAEIEQAKEMQKELDKSPSKHPGGRPSIYTKELADRICEQFALGKSVRTICKDEGMPGISTIFKWLREHDEFVEQYARAKEEAAELMVEDMLEIADDSSEDWVQNKKGNILLNKEAVMRSRVKVDTRKWIASKLKPKRYGDKLDLTTGNKPIDHTQTSAEIVSAVRDILASGKNDNQDSNSSDSNPSQ